MKIIQKEVLSIDEKESLMQLWNTEYPGKLNYETIHDFDLYLNGLTNAKHHLLIDEKWFAIIIDNQIHGTGKGSLLIEELKKNNDILNGWVVDHENDVKQNNEQYKSPLLFYLKNGFTVCEKTRIENEKISAVKINWTR